MDSVLAQLALLMGKLGLLSTGGSAVVLAEMRREVVGHGWMTDSQFVEAFALGQLAPGVGSLFVMPVGYQAAGLPGALVALAAYFGPPTALALLAAWGWQRLRASPWRQSLQVGLTPVALGLIAASVVVLGQAVVTNSAGLLILLGATAGLMRTRLNTVLVLALAALAGALLLRP